MIGGTKSPSNPSNLSNISSKSTTGNDFSLGSEEFPNLVPSKIASEKGVSENPNPDSRQPRLGMSYVGCLNNNTQSNASTKLSYDEAKMIDGESTAIFTSGELKNHISLCESYVVGYFVGKKLPFDLVKETLHSHWKLKGDFSMTIHGEKTFLFKFSQDEDREKVLELGSVFMGKSLFVIRPWSISLENNIDAISTVPVWMILRQVPLHLWNQLGLSRIASIVGTPIMTDTPTALKTRMSYARVLVEVSADCSFPSELPIQIDEVKSVVKAEYPWKPTSCSHCKSFGHSSAKCSLNPTPKVCTKWVPKVTSSCVDPSNSLVLANTIGDTHQFPQNREDTLIENGVGFLEHGSKTLEAPLTYCGKVNKALVATQAEVEWSTYNRRKKGSIGKGGVSTQIAGTNPFSVLDSTPELEEVLNVENLEVYSELKENEVGTTGTTSEIMEQRTCSGNEIIPNNYVTDNIDKPSQEEEQRKQIQVGLDNGEVAMEDLDCEPDAEVMAVEKLKPLEEVSRYKPMDRKQNMERLMIFGSKLNLSRGGKEVEVKNILGGIVDSFHHSKAMDLDPSKEELGRGKRTPKPNKKY